MNYRDTWHWPEVPVEEIDRDDIETVYSFGHNDGPASGLVRMAGVYFYAVYWEYRERPRRFWVVELTPEQQDYALRYGAEWARLFHNGMTWNTDGTNRPSELGVYGYREGNATGIYAAGRDIFYAAFPRVPSPHEEARVVGYFVGWRRESL